MKDLKKIIPINANSWRNLETELEKVRDNFDNVSVNTREINDNIGNIVSEMDDKSNFLVNKTILDLDVIDGQVYDSGDDVALVVDNGEIVGYVLYDNSDKGSSFTAYNSNGQLRIVTEDNDVYFVNAFIESTLEDADFEESERIDTQKMLLKDNEGNYYTWEGGDLHLSFGLKEYTYRDLVILAQNNQLVPGQWYRMTDYISTTTRKWATVIDTHYDIILQAVNTNRFSEDARAIAKKGDNYFKDAGSDPLKWKIKVKLLYTNPFNEDIIIREDNNFIIPRSNNYCYGYDFDNNELELNKNLQNIIFAQNTGNELISASTDVELFTINNDYCISDITSDYSGNFKVDDDVYPSIVYQNRGIITYMEDEFGNKAHYDFKTIVFARFKNKNNRVFYTDSKDSDGDYYYQMKAAAEWIKTNLGNNVQTNPSWWFTRGTRDDEDYPVQIGSGLNYSSFYEVGNDNTFEPDDDAIYKEMSRVADDNDTIIVEADPTPYFFFTFSKVTYSNNKYDITDESLNGHCYDNNIEVYDRNDDIPTPNGIVFMSYDNSLNVYYNNIGFDNYDNTFGNEIRYNTFGNSLYNNTFGNYVQCNTFGNNVSYNTFGNNIYQNTFGNSVSYNTFGNGIGSNTFGNEIYYNTFGNNIQYDTFGNNIYQNTFGNDIWYNTFGNKIRYNTFGNYVQCNTFGNNIQYFIFPSVSNSFIFSGLEGNDSFDRTDLNNIINSDSFFGKNSDDEWTSKSYANILD